MPVTETTPHRPRVRTTCPEKAAAVDAAIAAAKRRPALKRIERLLREARETPFGQASGNSRNAVPRECDARLLDAQRSFVKGAHDWLPYASEEAREALLELLALVYRGGATPGDFARAVAAERSGTMTGGATFSCPRS